jgi:hypothetical protein
MNQKLDVPVVIERVWETYRDQFTLLIPAALVIFVPIAIVNAVILSAEAVAAALLVALVALVASFWYQGMVVEAVQDILDGRRDHDVGSLFRSVMPVIGPLIGAGLLAGIAIGIGLILLIVPGLILLTIWAVIAPVIVLERAAVFESFGRSRELVRGSGWQVFGVIVVLFLLQLVFGGIVNAIFGGISDSLFSYAIAEIIVRSLIAPLSAIAAAVMYFELKRLKGEAVPVPAAAVPQPGAPVAQPTPPAEQPEQPAQPAPPGQPAPPEQPPPPPR